MTDSVAVAVVAAVGVIFTAGCGVVVAMLQRNHNAVNGRMTELLELTRQSSKAEGVKEGEEHNK